jgi:hypothetical protein
VHPLISLSAQSNDIRQVLSGGTWFQSFVKAVGLYALDDPSVMTPWSDWVPQLCHLICLHLLIIALGTNASFSRLCNVTSESSDGYVNDDFLMSPAVKAGDWTGIPCFLALMSLY